MLTNYERLMTRRYIHWPWYRFLMPGAARPVTMRGEYRGRWGVMGHNFARLLSIKA